MAPVEIVDRNIAINSMVDLSIVNQWFSIKYGDLPIKNVDFPIKHGGSFVFPHLPGEGC